MPPRGSPDVFVNDLRVLRDGDVPIVNISPEVQRLIDRLQAIVDGVAGQLEDLINNPPGLPPEDLAAIQALLEAAQAAADAAAAAQGNVKKIGESVEDMYRRILGAADETAQARHIIEEAMNEVDGLRRQAQELLDSSIAVRDEVVVAATSATTAAANANTSANQASVSATSASASAAQATISQTAAANSAFNANVSAGAAATSAASALSYSNAAQAFSEASESKSLTANAYSQFAQFLDVAEGGAFTFDSSSLDGWTNHSNTTVSNTGNGALRVVHSGANGIVKSPVINCDGAIYTKVRARAKIISGTFTDLSDVRLSYTTASRGSPTGHEMVPLAAAEIEPENGYVTLMWDIYQQPAEMLEWTTNDIEQVFLSMSPLASFTYELDYLYLLGEAADSVLEHANAAVTSAANAAASESLASSYATASLTNATNAASSAGAASTSASQASTSATNAAGSAVTATTQAGAAAASAFNASMSAAALFPPDFTVDKSSWTDTLAGAPSAVATTTASIVNDGTLGVSLELTGNNRALFSKGVLIPTAGRVYKIEVVGRQTVNPTDGNGTIRLSLRSLDSAYADIGGPAADFTSGVTVAGGTFVFSAKFSDVADAPNGVVAWTGGASYLRPYIQTAFGEAGSPVTRIKSIKITDVTDSHNAALSAAAASVSETNSATSASTAVGSASTATTQANLAASSAFNAAMQASSLFPPDFTIDKLAWTDSVLAGSPATAATTTKSIVTDGTLGQALELVGVIGIASKGVLLPTTGRVYKIEVVGRQTVNPTDGTSTLTIGMYSLDGTYGGLTAAFNTFTSGINVAGGQFTFSQKFSDTADAPNGVIAWAGSPVYLRPYIQANTGESGSPVTRIKLIKITDVTDSHNAAISSASASVSQTAAASSASSAAGSAASATISTVLAARLAQGVLLTKNPIFQDWSGTYPAGYVLWQGAGGTISKETSAVRYGSNAVRMQATSANQLGIQIVNADPDGFVNGTNPEYVVIEVEVEVLAGNRNALGVWIGWVNTIGTSFPVELSSLNFTLIAPTIAELRRVVPRPAGWTGTFSHLRLILMANYQGSGWGSYTNKTVLWHKASVRTATDEEIRTYNVADEISAAVSVEAGVRLASDNSISAKYGVKVDVNGHVSGFGLISTANNAAPFSEFTVAADKLKVAYPAGGVSSGQQMFEVGLVDGVTKMVLKGDFIADGTITTSGLTLTDPSNVIANTDFSHGLRDWYLLAGSWAWFAGTNADSAAGWIRLTGNGSVVSFISGSLHYSNIMAGIKVRPTEEYYVSFNWRRSSTITSTPGVFLMTKDPDGNISTVFINTIAAGSNSSFAQVVTTAVIPSGVRRIFFYVYWNSNNGELLDFSNIVIRRKVDNLLISDGTISAQKLNIAPRGINIDGVQFSHNSPSSNRVSWTAGTIRYINTSGTATTASITAETVGILWSSGVIYLYWVEGATTISNTTTAATAFAAGNIVLGTYQGGTLLYVDYGRTTIEGNRINAASIAFADGTILTSAIGANAVSASVVTTSNTNTTVSGTTETTIVSATMTPVGGQVVLNALFQMKPRTTGSEDPEVTTASSITTTGVQQTILVRFYRGATLIGSYQVALPIKMIVKDFPSVGGYGAHIGGEVSALCVDTTPGTSSVTYSVTVTTVTTTSTYATIYIDNKSLVCLNLKK